MNFRDLVEAAKAQGFEVARTSSNHWRFRPPDPTKEIVVHSGTSCSERGLRNLLATLRRSGLRFR